MLMDVSPIGNENTVHFAADGADEVDRDLLA
jgi:ribose 5-phosphate isomerase